MIKKEQECTKTPKYVFWEPIQLQDSEQWSYFNVSSLQ